MRVLLKLPEKTFWNLQKISHHFYDFSNSSGVKYLMNAVFGNNLSKEIYQLYTSCSSTAMAISIANF